MSGEGKSRTIKVDYLARVEGEGALHLRLRDGRAEEVRLEIFEPPRYFEALLRGRDRAEAPDITARICGICPVAYQMSAVHAVEAAAGVRVSGPLRDLRRLLYCGEWIESHALHIYMLHAPDFLGYPDAIQLARVAGDAVRRGLALKKAGNAILRVVGGREVHPINVRVGGFWRAPSRRELLALVPDLERARGWAEETLAWVGGFPFPEAAHDYEFVALRHRDEYPMNEGRIVSSGGIDIAQDEFDTVFEEQHLPHSTALHARIRGRGPYLVGPLARWALNADRLPATIRTAAERAGLPPACRNPFRSIIARAAEVLHSCEEALAIIARYVEPEVPAIDVPLRAAVGQAATEAPRGLLHHRYVIAADGRIETARIVPPTSQNQATIEADLRAVAEHAAALDDEALRHLCEQAIRNHDPCISCATHFLHLTVDRG